MGQLVDGKWQQAFASLSKLVFWLNIDQAEEVKERLLGELKKSALVCFMLNYAAYFTQVSKQALATQFEVSEAVLLQVLEDYRLKDSLQITWSGDKGEVTLNKTEPVDYLVGTLLATKTEGLTIANELEDAESSLSDILQHSVARESFNISARKKLVNFAR